MTLDRRTAARTHAHTLRREARPRLARLPNPMALSAMGCRNRNQTNNIPNLESGDVKVEVRSDVFPFIWTCFYLFPLSRWLRSLFSWLDYLFSSELGGPRHCEAWALVSALPLV